MADDDETGLTRYCALALLCVVVTASCWLWWLEPRCRRAVFAGDGNAGRYRRIIAKGG